MKKAHHRLRRFCAVVIGLVFLASGLLKLLDPVGTGLIVSEYFKFFHLGFLQGTAKVLGMVLSLVEAATGAALVSGVFRKPTAVVTSVLVVFFTIITLILWIAKPDMDCGCFGEAIHLSHGQTLLKNVVLLALSAAAFLPFQNFGVPRKGKYVAFFLAIPSLVFALWHNARHLPMIDFTEFAPGAELFASLDNDYQEMDGKVPTFIYERNGQRGSAARVLHPGRPAGFHLDLRRGGHPQPQRHVQERRQAGPLLPGRGGRVPGRAGRARESDGILRV